MLPPISNTRDGQSFLKGGTSKIFKVVWGHLRRGGALGGRGRAFKYKQVKGLIPPLKLPGNAAGPGAASPFN